MPEKLLNKMENEGLYDCPSGCEPSSQCWGCSCSPKTYPKRETPDNVYTCMVCSGKHPVKTTLCPTIDNKGNSI